MCVEVGREALLSSRNPDARILLLILKPYIAFLNTFFSGNKKKREDFAPRL